MNDNSKPLVSVVIPVYNVAKYLSNALDSVCRQTYTRLEIILVYTHSTDDSLVVCERYAKLDSRIVITNENRPGLGLARDKGISIAKGDWICFLDSDDYIHSEFVNVLLDAVLQHDCLTAHCRFIKVYGKQSEDNVGDGTVKLMDWEKYFCYLHTHEKEGHSPYGAWANIYHRSLFNNASFGSLRYAEDSAFTPKIIYAARGKKIAVIDRVLYYYLQREGSLLHQPISLIRIDQCKAKKMALDFFKSVGAQNMYHLFYPIYCSFLMYDYIDLSISLPEKKNEYQHLYDEFIKELPHMKEYCFPFLGVNPHAKFVWDKILNYNGKIVLYGFGRFGKKIVDTLKNAHVDIQEIWDRKFKETTRINGIICQQMHGGLSKDTLVLISIIDWGVVNEARIDLRNLGYENFIDGAAIRYAVNYANIKQYFPEVLDEYDFRN